MSRQLVKISKMLSFVLRHEPRSIGITLDEAGWIGVRELLNALASHGTSVTEAELPKLFRQTTRNVSH